MVNLPFWSAHMWAPDDGCRGSVAMIAANPEPNDLPKRQEGRAAHWYVAELLAGRDVAAGAVAPNGHPVTAEMVDCAQSLLIDVRDTLRAAGGGTLRIEERVQAALIHPDNAGFPDVYFMDRGRRALHLWEYKFGRRFVDAPGNWQLLNQAVAILECEGLTDPETWRGWQITLTVVQPRNYSPLGPVREWPISGDRLADEYLPRLRQSAHEAMQPNAPFRTGAHCIGCSGRHVCPVLQRAGALAMDISMQGQPVLLTPHAVGLELRLIDDAIKRLEARQTGLEEHALGLIRGGTHVAFYTAIHGAGREIWNVPEAQVVALGALFDVDLAKPATLTPAQARKAGLPPAAMAAMTDHPKGALKLERVNDDAARLAFEGE